MKLYQSKRKHLTIYAHKNTRREMIRDAIVYSIILAVLWWFFWR